VDFDRHSRQVEPSIGALRACVSRERPVYPSA
jgi:hypothetical protein